MPPMLGASANRKDEALLRGAARGTAGQEGCWRGPQADAPLRWSDHAAPFRHYAYPKFDRCVMGAPRLRHIARHAGERRTRRAIELPVAAKQGSRPSAVDLARPSPGPLEALAFSQPRHRPAVRLAVALPRPQFQGPSPGGRGARQVAFGTLPTGPGRVLWAASARRQCRTACGPTCSMPTHTNLSKGDSHISTAHHTYLEASEFAVDQSAPDWSASHPTHILKKCRALGESPRPLFFCPFLPVGHMRAPLAVLLNGGRGCMGTTRARPPRGASTRRTPSRRRFLRCGEHFVRETINTVRGGQQPVRGCRPWSAVSSALRTRCRSMRSLIAQPTTRARRGRGGRPGRACPAAVRWR